MEAFSYIRLRLAPPGRLRHARSMGCLLVLWLYAAATGPIALGQSPPVITQQPVSSLYFEGLPFVLEAKAVGDEPLDYQWLRDATPLPGAIGSALYCDGRPFCFAGSTATEGAYQLVVTNAFGAVTSLVAQVTVTPGPLNGWTVRRGISYSFGFAAVTYGGGMFAAAGRGYANNGYLGIILTSPDGIEWTERFSQPDLYLNDIQYSGGRFLAVSGIDSVFCSCPGIVTSTNGFDWVAHYVPGVRPLSAATGGGGLLLAAGGNAESGQILTSSNASDWKVTPFDRVPWITAAAYGGGNFIVAGTRQGLVSGDGQTWNRFDFPFVSDESARLTDLIFDGQRFVAVQLRGYSLTTDFLTSTNGSNWIRSGFLTNWITSIAHSTENYVGVGRGVIYGSLDAARWSFELATPPSRWVGVAFGGGTFVAVSDEGAILQSGIRTLPYLTLSAEGLGKVIANPDQKDYQTGDTVTLTAAPDRWFTFAQWTDGATSNPRTIRVNASPLANNYIAVFRPTVPLETVSLGGVSRLAPIGTPAILVDGQFVTDGVVSRFYTAMIQIQSTFTNGLVLYSVDGSEPSLSGRIYAGAFNVSRDTTIRARAYSPDFARAADSDPVRVEFVPRPASFTLSVVPSGGGEVLLNPSGGNYPSNAIVSVTAVPNTGWQLVQWLGDVATTNSTVRVSMTRDLRLQPVFGTALATTVAGDGVILRHPARELYPFGSRVQLVGIPGTGSGFGLWGDSAASAVNPLIFTITNAAPRVSGLFTPLVPGEFSFAVDPVGRGHTETRPRGSRFREGQLVSLLASPDPGQEFLGWSGGVSSTNNPLALAVHQSLKITATFTKRPTLSVVSPQGGNLPDLITLRLDGEAKTHYGIEVLSDFTLGGWVGIGSVSNFLGTVEWRETAPRTTARFYRARALDL